MSTWAWYDENGNGTAFAAKTRHQDVRHILAPFMESVDLLGGHILDVGCGSGRDTRAFSLAGYQVTAIDPSETMIQETRDLVETGPLLLPPILEQRGVLEVTETEVYHGIWACNSLLHLPHRDQTDALRRLRNALKPGGSLFVSYKYGSTQRLAEDGRFFNDMTFGQLGTLLEFVGLVPRTMTLTDHKGVPFWINALCTRPA